MSRFRFYPEAETWTRAELRLELELAARAYVARLARGSTADSERECVLELAIVLGQRALDDERDADTELGTFDGDDPETSS